MCAKLSPSACGKTSRIYVSTDDQAPPPPGPPASRHGYKRASPWPTCPEESRAAIGAGFPPLFGGLAGARVGQRLRCPSLQKTSRITRRRCTTYKLRCKIAKRIQRGMSPIANARRPLIVLRRVRSAFLSGGTFQPDANAALVSQVTRSIALAPPSAKSPRAARR